MKVTVLLPVYNAGQYLIRGIESILEQQFSEFDFLIIDDCSTDNSAEVISRFVSQDSRIRAVFHSQQAGLAATLNEGLALSGCEFIVRMDQDDESLPNRLQTQISYMESCPEVVVAGSYVYHMGSKPEFDRLVELPTESEKIKQTLVKYNCLYHPSVILRRAEVVAIGGYRSKFKNAEDYDLWLRVSRYYSLANIPEPLLRYRFSVNGMTLGRKWEQLFYVYLAQATHEGPDVPSEEIQATAEQMLAQTNKRYFMTEVLKGTIAELIGLRLWIDALKITLRLRGDVGEKVTLRLLAKITRSFIRSCMKHI